MPVRIFLIEIVGIGIEEVPVGFYLQISGKTLSQYVNKSTRMGNMNTGSFTHGNLG
jgi:hypothetical protein